MEEMRTVSKILDDKPEMYRSLGRSESKWEDNIKFRPKKEGVRI
jgi:hypothetical protein